MDDIVDSGAEFRRNFVIVLVAHVALVAAVWLLGGRTKSAPQEQITWLDGGGLGVTAPSESQAPPEAPVEPPPSEQAAPPSTPPPLVEPEPPAEPPPPPEPAPKVEEDLAPTPKPTPAPTPSPKRTVSKITPKPTPTKSTPKPTATKRVTPKPTAESKPTPKVTEVAKAEHPSPKPTPRETPNGGTGTSGRPGGTTAEGNGGKGAPGGTPNGAEVTKYFSEVGETFRPIWKQYKPVSTVATGDELIARVRVRIDSSGRVESARLVRSTGNQEVDASVEKAFPEFRSVPPPPSALLKNNYFEENMDVILRL